MKEIEIKVAIIVITHLETSVTLINSNNLTKNMINMKSIIEEMIMMTDVIIKEEEIESFEIYILLISSLLNEH